MITYRLPPPSTQIVCPVINAASSDSKNSIVAAISSGFPNLPIGIEERTACSSELPTGRILLKSSVSIGPGAMAFIVTPNGANSNA
jgi:hypothetical protein